MSATNDVVHVIAHLTARAESATEVRVLLLQLLEATRREEGCMQYDLLVDEFNPAAFTFVERWTDADALEDHFRTAHFLSAGKQLGSLLAEPPRIIRMKQVA